MAPQVFVNEAVSKLDVKALEQVKINGPDKNVCKRNDFAKDLYPAFDECTANAAEVCPIKQRLKIKSHLDPDRRSELTAVMSDYAVDFLGDDGRDHHVACAATKAMTALMDDHILSKVKSDHLKHIGESPIKLILQEKFEHDCLNYDKPDVRDIARKKELLSFFKTSDSLKSSESQAVAKQFMERYIQNINVDVTCGKEAQGCYVPAKILRCRNIQDISPEQVSTAMAESGAEIAAGILMYHPCIFMPGVCKGQLPFTKFSFFRIHEGGEEKIVFRGPGDSQDTYVHRWSAYSSWFVGEPRVRIRHQDRRYESSFIAAAMDHIIWKMCRVYSDPQITMNRKFFPQMSNSRTTMLYGAWYDDEHSEHASLVRSKKNYTVMRVGHVPTRVLKAAERLSKFYKRFTFAVAQSNLNGCMKLKVEGVPYSEMYTWDEDTVLFASVVMYEELFSSKFQKNYIDIGTRIDLREPNSSFWMKKWLSSLFEANKDDKDFRYVDSEGRPRAFSAEQMELLFSLCISNKMASARRKHNVAKLRPILSSSIFS